MSSLFSLAQFVTSASDYHFMAMVYKSLEKFFQIKRFRTPVHKSHIVDAERRLQLSHLVELIQNHIGIGIALYIDGYMHLTTRAGVRNICYALNLFFLYKVGNAFYDGSRRSRFPPWHES